MALLEMSAFNNLFFCANVAQPIIRKTRRLEVDLSVSHEILTLPDEAR
jgi:hypothetical protein